MQKVTHYIHKYGVYATVLMVGLIVGGFAMNRASASIPDSSGTIHSCRNNITTMLRVIDSDSYACGSDETGLNWDQNGVKGYAHITYNNSTGAWVLDSARSKNITSLTTPVGSSETACLTLNTTPRSVSVASYDSSTVVRTAIKDGNGWAGPSGHCGSVSGANVRLVAPTGEGIGFFVTLY